MKKKFFSRFTRLSRFTSLTSLLALAVVAQANNPYIYTVYSYQPAPGQFINVLSDPSVLIGATGSTDHMLCLGAWGGEVVFGFDHPVLNLPDSMDFEVLGNYFASTIIDGRQTGSSEPGIIWVSRDGNKNGEPDDPWYEIRGSEYDEETHDYSITYYQPQDTAADVMGIDSKGDTIWVKHNAFHAQTYYPRWLADSSYTLSGSLLPSNISGITLYTLDYGYADNAVNGTRANYIDLDWAVDVNGTPVQLSQIDFVKVQTGVSQDGGMMGETSTEVTGARDLHPNAMTALDETESGVKARTLLWNGRIFIQRSGHAYTISGVKVY